MTAEQAGAIVDAIVNGLEFRAPISLEDLALLHGAIKSELPGLLVEVNQQADEVIVQVHEGTQRVLRRAKPVLP